MNDFFLAESTGKEWNLFVFVVVHSLQSMVPHAGNGPKISLLTHAYLKLVRCRE